MKFLRRVFILCAAAVLAACASSEQALKPHHGPDPFESVNRDIWDFNWDILDKHIVRPLTVTYVEYMPAPARKGLYNAALNLEEPASAVNNLLQGKFGDSATSVGRFVINSTLGVFGLFDVAESISLSRKDEEFGETLGVWGVGTGPFLMIPAMGPNDPRNLTGDVVDGSYFPLADLNGYVTILTTAIKAIELRANLMEQEQLIEQSVDPYAMVKDIYFQQQAFKVSDGKVERTEQEKALDEDIDAYLDDL